MHTACQGESLGIINLHQYISSKALISLSHSAEATQQNTHAGTASIILHTAGRHGHNNVYSVFSFILINAT